MTGLFPSPRIGHRQNEIYQKTCQDAIDLRKREAKGQASICLTDRAVAISFDASRLIGFTLGGKLMARQARGEVIDPLQVQVVHCVQRCVRRAFLCGDDSLTRKSFEHRREWIRQRLEFLASVFAIDCLTYTLMSNHIHLVLRSRPDVLESWSDEEVARRWLRLFPKRRNPDGTPAEPSQLELKMILNDPEVLAARRRRLSDLSWWMRCTAENIARRSNAEDEVTGHFWKRPSQCTPVLRLTRLVLCGTAA